MRGVRICARAVVLAAGVAYRRLGVPELDAYVGSGVYYGAATAMAREMKGRHVVVVGGGNSAGQAAIHLATCAAQACTWARSGVRTTRAPPPWGPAWKRARR